jgi:hypothetical protein
MWPVPHREELPVPNSLENLTFSNYNSDYDEDHGQQEGDNVDSNLIFEASCSSSEYFSSKMIWYFVMIFALF